MALEIKWMPMVCECVIMQDRHDPDNLYSFQSKCEIHSNLSDSEARASIIQMCIDEQEQNEQ